jgi:hypothetical protein
MAIPIDSAQKGRIPLVISACGIPLRTIADCEEWCQAYNKARQAKKNRKRAGGLVHIPISSDSESPFPHHSPDPPEPSSFGSEARHQGAKKGKPSHIDVPDSSGSESESDHPEPSTDSHIKDKHRKHHHSSKKRSRSQNMSDSESEDPDTAKQAKKRTKKSRGKKGGSHHHNPERHHKNAKKAKRYNHNGKAMMHIYIYIFIQSKYTCHRFTEEMDKSGTA